MRDKLLALTDFLVERKDAEGLRLLREVTFDLFCSEFEVENLSLIELNDYISDALTEINRGTSSEEILALPIRKLIDDYSILIYFPFYIATANRIKQLFNDSSSIPVNSSQARRTLRIFGRRAA